MNQQASALLFSEQTAKGLDSIGDESGSKCVKVICHGLAALDESGLSSETRINDMISMKAFLEENNDLVERIKRPDRLSMTNELLQMVLTTIDSYFYNQLNMQFLNIRRKGKLINI